MTREEAIEKLELMRQKVDEETYRALILAIKALSQEPCDDAISREAVIEATHHCGDLQEVREVVQQLPSVNPQPCDDAVSREAFIKKYDEWTYSEYGHHAREDSLAIRVIKSLPSVTQKSGKWIPVSERLPEDKTYVLTTIKVPNRIAHARSSWYEGGFFHNDNGDTWRATDMEVKAWMPLPKPYEPQESEDKE